MQERSAKGKGEDRSDKKNINIKGNKVIEMVPDLYGNNPDVH